jgi:Tol biopolymer transport system component
MIYNHKNAIVIFLLLIHYNSQCQFLDILSGNKISSIKGDEALSSWSPNGDMLVYQGLLDSNYCMYVYNTSSDSTSCFSQKNVDFKNPTWHPNGTSLVFNSNMNGNEYIYTLDLTTSDILPLFKRKIECKNPSFSKTGRQVYFSGYNNLKKKWDIYSYDFIYDNLNNITEYDKFSSNHPKVSPNGKLIAYTYENPFDNSKELKIINWYGEAVEGFPNINGKHISWDANGLKILFISDALESKNEIFSVWKDGTHLQQITKCHNYKSYPAVSADGKKISISLKTDNGWDIYIIPFEDY